MSESVEDRIRGRVTLLRITAPSRPVTATTAVWTAIVILFAARVVLAVLAWEPGWSALTWDDFTRVEMARAWAASPQLAPDLVWLPAPIWITGIAFKTIGAAFRANPMLLTAIINTTAAIATAAVVGWTARRLTNSVSGGLIAFTSVLFAPWAVFTSLSGLGEPIYYLAVAGVIAVTVGWLQTRRLIWLIAGVGCASAAAACRYEGWSLIAAWALVLGAVEVGRPGSGFARRVWNARLHLGIIATGAFGPLAWIGLNASRTGEPFYFFEASARAFTSAYGTVTDPMARILYYPMALVRSAPLLLGAAAAIAFMRRRDRIVAIVVSIIAIQFGALYLTSLVSTAVGAFNERFLFAFAIALAPLLGFVPRIGGRLKGSRMRSFLAVGVAIAAVVLTSLRLGKQPVEWSQPPDLLALTESLGAFGELDDPLKVVVGPGMATDLMPLVVRNGATLAIFSEPAVPLTGPPLDSDTVWIERLPERIASISLEPTVTIGRFAVYGSREIPVEPCVGCTGWTLTDEFGTTRSIPPGPFVPLEFTGDDPFAGSEAVVTFPVTPSSSRRTARMELRSLYGHGFNPGRIEMQIRVDGAVVFARDIAEPSRWLTIDIPIAAATGSVIEVAVVAQPDIEAGWGWGRASTVLIRYLEVSR